MALLDEPMEFIDLLHGQSMTLEISRFLEGSAIIHPTAITPRHVRIHMDQHNMREPPVAGTPIHNEVPVLRLFGKRLDEASRSPYWDTSSKTLQADLIARLRGPGLFPMRIKITANGVKPLKRYSVEVISA